MKLTKVIVPVNIICYKNFLSKSDAFMNFLFYRDKNKFENKKGENQLYGGCKW